MSSPSIHFAGPDAQVMVLVCPPQVISGAAEELFPTVVRHLPDRDDVSVVMDFTDTVQISSVGIAGILQTRELCLRKGIPYILAGLSSQLIEFLTMLRLIQHFTIEPTLEEAISKAGQRT